MKRQKKILKTKKIKKAVKTRTTKIKKSLAEDEEFINAADEFNDNESGIELDIPGSELDDAQEMIGSEDEENNYYSIGGDDHEDLEESHAE